MSPPSLDDHRDWLGGEALVRHHGRRRLSFYNGGLRHALTLGLVFLAGLTIGASAVILWQPSRHTVRKTP